MDLVNVQIAHPGEDPVKSAQQAVVMAQTYQIDCAEMATAAAMDLGDIKRKMAALEKSRKAMKEPILAAGRAVEEFFKGPMSFLEKAEAILKRQLADWDTKQRRLADANRKAAEEAAASERARLRAEAEATRAAAIAAERKAAEEMAAMQAEADAKMLEAMQANDAAAMARVSEEAAENERKQAAQEAEAAALADQVRAAEAAAMLITAPVVVIEKTAGIQYRDKWVAEVTDKGKLIAACVAGTAPIGLLLIDETMLRKMAEAQKGELRLPGVEVRSEKVVVARS